jgi:hypothetical protein
MISSYEKITIPVTVSNRKKNPEPLSRDYLAAKIIFRNAQAFGHPENTPQAAVTVFAFIALVQVSGGLLSACALSGNKPL